MSWCGHLIHISLPMNSLLDLGLDATQLPSPQDVLFKDFQASLFPSLRSAQPLVNFNSYLKKHLSLLGSTGQVFNSSSCNVFLAQVTAHHFYLGIVFILSSIIALRLSYRIAHVLHLKAWDAQLSLNLAITASLSLAFAHHIYAIPIYPFCASDYPTVLCLFYHHMWVGGFLMIGAAAHASIFIITEHPSNSFYIVNHRDVLLGHLLWVTLALGLHSFRLYIHNDTLEAFGRQEDLFNDNAIQLKTCCWVQSFPYLSFDIKVLDRKVMKITQELGTADFIVHHIHAFTLHTTVLILCKGVLYSRNSRLVSDKFQLGFRYPCDGPGRGGTCQISPWDHISLAIFWMYNALSVVLFHFFWKMQSDVWGIYDISSQRLMHLTGGDLSVHSITINGWLRNFLWSQPAQVIQSYHTCISGYGFIFISAHFLWAFSLMFL